MSVSKWNNCAYRRNMLYDLLGSSFAHVRSVSSSTQVSLESGQRQLSSIVRLSCSTHFEHSGSMFCSTFNKELILIYNNGLARERCWVLLNFGDLSRHLFTYIFEIIISDKVVLANRGRGQWRPPVVFYSITFVVQKTLLVLNSVRGD